MNAPVNPKELELQTVEFKLDGQTIVSYEGETILRLQSAMVLIFRIFAIKMAIVLMVIAEHAWWRSMVNVP
jgi:hypothetical protein